MKIYKASYIVAKLSKKYNANKIWIWDIMEDQYNIIKGLGCVITSEQVKVIEEIIIDGLSEDVCDGDL